MSRPVSPPKPVPRGFVLLMGLLLLLLGAGGMVVLGNTLFARTLKFHSWDAVPCTVLQAETITRGTDIDGNLVMDAKVQVAWEYNGHHYAGGKLDADTGFYTAESVNAKEELCHRLRKNLSPVCYVNPDKPEESILRLPEWTVVAIFASLALAVMVLGAGIMFVSRGPPLAGSPAGPGPRAMVLVLVVGVMFFAGGTAVWWFGVRGATDWSVVGARMKEVPCIVVSAAIGRSGGGRTSTPTYRPKVFYKYEWDGRTWHSEWYSFDKTAPGSSDRRDAEKMLLPYGPGTDHTCSVDPEQPWAAVLEKSGGGFVWLWIPAGLLLLTGAFFISLAGGKLKRKSASTG